MDQVKTSVLWAIAILLLEPALVGGRRTPSDGTPSQLSPGDSDVDIAADPWFENVARICPTCELALLSFIITAAWLACTTTGARARTYLATAVWTLVLALAALLFALGLVYLDELVLPLCLTVCTPVGWTGHRLRRWFRHNFYLLTTGATFIPEDADEYNERRQAAARPVLPGCLGATAGAVYHLVALLVRPVGVALMMLLVGLLEAFVIPLVDPTAATASAIRNLKSLAKELVGPDFRVAPFHQW